MTVRELIGYFNEKKVLEGLVTFKIIKDSGKGDKWFFYCDQKENPAETVDEFCSHEGIRDCMDLTVDESSIYTDMSWEEDEKGNPINHVIHVHCHVNDLKEYLEEIKELIHNPEALKKLGGRINRTK